MATKKQGKVRAPRSSDNKTAQRGDFITNYIFSIPLVISLVIFAASVVNGDFSRGPTRRSAFMELARFEDCGIAGTPIAEFVESTRLACGMRCLENPNCNSYEFNEVNTTCNLHNVSALLNLETKYGYTYADGVNPNVGAQHPCEGDPCNSGNLCIEECVPNGFTCKCPEGLMGPFCDSLAPVDGGFTEWGEWSECSDSCRRTRYRNCTNPRVVAGGKDCENPNTGVNDCSTPCTVYPHINCLKQNDFKNDHGAVEVLDESDMTVDMCIQHCSYYGYRFAGVKDSSCRCARNMMTTHTDAEGASWDCSTDCPGDASQTCGGSGYVSIYATGTNYRGCYRGLPLNSVVVIEPQSPTTESPTTTDSAMTTSQKLTTTQQTTTTEKTTTAAGGVTAGNSSAGSNMTEGNNTSRFTTARTTTMPPTTHAPTTTEGMTTQEVTTTAPYPGITVNECLDECALMGYTYASLHNGSYCLCHNTLGGLALEFEDEASCSIECAGGNDYGGGLMCGGDGYISVFQTAVYDTTSWTEWYSGDSPVGDGADDESLSAFQAAQPWICDNPVDIECRTTDGVRYDKTGDTLAIPCTLSEGLNCTMEEQIIYFNLTVNITEYETVTSNLTREVEQYGCALYGVAPNGTLVYLEPYQPPVTHPTTSAPTNHGTTASYTTTVASTGSPLYLNTTVQCANATVELVDLVTLNQSTVIMTWRLTPTPDNHSCEDYMIRVQCKKEQDKYIGCYGNSDVSDLTTSPMALDSDMCASSCREAGYRYMGLNSLLGQCACGNSMTNQIKDYSLCTETCGVNNEPCGGNGTQSVYFTGCELPFNLNKTTMMTGTLMHNNDASDDYGSWFYHLDESAGLSISNFTNKGVQLDFQLDVDLGSVKTVSKLKTKGIYISGTEAWTGVTSFTMGYRLDTDHDVELFTDPGSTEATVFDITSVSSVTTHDLQGFLAARFFHFYVHSYTDFPAFKLEMFGCTD
ncbi:uncharacterized protein [Diadema antillarum]|uniref:uncharacterized protein n=1 Tax=Diadema antillarum TaxID=105358 RepID=UPI003A8B3C04